MSAGEASDVRPAAGESSDVRPAAAGEASDLCPAAGAECPNLRPIVGERLDLRPELVERLREPETRRRIADALIIEATGGQPDPKTGLPKGGATVIRAFELIREIALEPAPEPVDGDGDLSRYTDIELSAMLARLEAEPS
ncbi:MAG: hypothetical protein IKO14_07040 [Oscillibacter sp.]|nr:hypothetical protein [Oscillibacter sp.]